MTTKTDTEQERAAFEWWASDEGESPRSVERAGECYKLSQIQSYWVAWMARAALQSQKPSVEFEDPRVQLVYGIICGYNHPPAGEHWDGYVSRLIVDALQSQSPTLDVDALAQEIRRVGGSHSLGAGALAEALMPFIQSDLQSKDREDALRFRFCLEYGFPQKWEEGNRGAIRTYWTPRPGSQEDFPSAIEAIDHARRIEGEGK